MRVPIEMSRAFGAPFEELLGRFAAEKGLLPEPSALSSSRFLARSVAPHIRKLSALFNRQGEDQVPGLAPYWKESSNPAHLRLAYFLAFMPTNLYRVASVWAELARLGFRWNGGPLLKAIELGAGPAVGASGIATGERFAPVGLPSKGHWALVEQDKAVLELGREWASEYIASLGEQDWGMRAFHRSIDLERGLLPPTAPKFNLWVTSFFLNEFTAPPSLIAKRLLAAWDRHLEKEAVIVMIEPALKAQSRRLLEVRKEILASSEFQLLLPCLGDQACGALENPEDWCHEEVSWWRPPYLRALDKMTGLDRKTLPFSYLVLARSSRGREELLPALAGQAVRHRLVSPAHSEGKEHEFFLCGQAGKLRGRYRAAGPDDPAAELERGDILLGAEIRGDSKSARITSIKRRV